MQRKMGTSGIHSVHVRCDHLGAEGGGARQSAVLRVCAGWTGVVVADGGGLGRQKGGWGDRGNAGRGRM